MSNNLDSLIQKLKHCKEFSYKTAEPRMLELINEALSIADLMRDVPAREDGKVKADDTSASASNPANISHQTLIELVARAIHAARGHNPDTLHQHIDFGDGKPQYPNDKTEQYAAFNEPRTRHLHYGWRHDVKTAKAAIEAYEAAKPSEIPVINKAFGERLHPKVSKAYDKWVKANHDNPMIKGNCGFETFLAGWQTHEATKRESSDQTIMLKALQEIAGQTVNVLYQDGAVAGNHYEILIAKEALAKIEDGKSS